MFGPSVCSTFKLTSEKSLGKMLASNVLYPQSRAVRDTSNNDYGKGKTPGLTNR